MAKSPPREQRQQAHDPSAADLPVHRCCVGHRAAEGVVTAETTEIREPQGAPRKYPPPRGVCGKFGGRISCTRGVRYETRCPGGTLLGGDEAVQDLRGGGVIG